MNVMGIGASRFPSEAQEGFQREDKGLAGFLFFLTAAFGKTKLKVLFITEFAVLLFYIERFFSRVIIIESLFYVEYIIIFSMTG